MSISKKVYALVVFVDYSNTHRYCSYIQKRKQHKSSLHIKKIENEANLPMRAIRSDNESELYNRILNDFYTDKGISRQYSSPRTPHQTEW